MYKLIYYNLLLLFKKTTINKAYDISGTEASGFLALLCSFNVAHIYLIFGKYNYINFDKTTFAVLMVVVFVFLL